MSYIQLTSQNIYEVIENNTIVIVDFWAPWCGPCISFSPIFEKVASNHPEITFAKVNIEEEELLAAHFQIQTVPAVMVFKEKILIFNELGAKNEEELNNLVLDMKAIDMDQFRAEIEAKKSEI
jgi:thioredoxin 1